MERVTRIELATRREGS